MKTERSNVKFPMWRKKVDSSLLKQKGTTIPNWVCEVSEIDRTYTGPLTKKNEKSNVTIFFKKKRYKGHITLSNSSDRKTQAYRLWFNDDLLYEIKHTFLMSYMRDIEKKLMDIDPHVELLGDIEDIIPFWEFLDIEIDVRNGAFYFTAHYIQKPSFPELFRRLVDSNKISRVDDEILGKSDYRFYYQDWKLKKELDFEIEVSNVLYTLIDSKKKLLYVGEAGKLVKRLQQPHTSITSWDYYKYIELPYEIDKKKRVKLERMMIREYASLLKNKKDVGTFSISEYELANDKIDK